MALTGNFFRNCQGTTEYIQKDYQHHLELVQRTDIHWSAQGLIHRRLHVRTGVKRGFSYRPSCSSLWSTGLGNNQRHKKEMKYNGHRSHNYCCKVHSRCKSEQIDVYWQPQCRSHFPNVENKISHIFKLELNASVGSIGIYCWIRSDLILFPVCCTTVTERRRKEETAVFWSCDAC